MTTELSRRETLFTALTNQYRVERELGAGGMATVYLAHDVKHDRKVALKVLKPELAAVLGADRFVVEIKTTASLSHPHILPLFDSGSAEGQLYYVMPYVEGETLRDKLNRETQLGVEEAVRIATEVADALDYAHRHGVIHRDIKPENILLHDGRPMVADFGIALAVSAAAGGRMTETGLSLGTPHYMSPEQATADKEISGRSDIYSLASVLYEMLTGQPPHTGASAQQIIMKIIAEPVEAVTKYRKAVPAHVAAAVSKALEKLPADRFDSAKAFASALTNPAFAQGTVATSATPLGRTRGVPVPLFALSAAIALLALLATGWAWLRPKPPLEVSRFNITLPDSQALVGTQANGSRIALSRDGRMIAYQGEESRTRGRWLYLRRLDRLGVERLAGTENGVNPAFSPDGKRLAFVGGSPRALKVISLAGGPPQVLTDSLVDLGGVSWGPDGYIYYDGHFEGDGLARIRETGGKPEIASRPTGESESWHSMPWALPNGRGVLFAIARARGASPFDIAVLDTRTGTHRVLVRGMAPRYTESGHLLYVAEDGALMATRFDPDRLTTIGEPIAMTAGVSVMGLGRADVEISQQGTLLYAAGAPQARDRELLWVARTGQASAVDSGWTKQIRTLPALSPDGRSVAVGLQVGAAGFETWVKQLDRGPASKIADVGITPVWSPNGQDIAYWGSGGIHVGPADGSVLPRLRYPRSARTQSFEYSPDGQWIVGSATGDIVAFGTGDTTTVPLLVTPAIERRPTISPDGRWLAYESDEGGTMQVYVRPFPAAQTAKRQVSVDGGMLPRWSRDGRELFFIAPSSFDFIAVPVSLSPTFSTGIPQVLFNASFNFPPLPFDVDIDGKRFLMTRPVGGAKEAPDELVVVENFVEELRTRLPDDAGMLDALTTALADRYLIERELGQGGMATVYLAHDVRHDRDVALKVLRPELAESLGRQRFLREIRLAARLNHPHILPLYDSGDVRLHADEGSVVYFVMPVMQGQTLRDRLRGEGQLPVELAVRIASEVADALDYAHRHDVVHRDIKPENILLHEGHAVVADFGIGKAIVAAASETSTFTQIGVTVGTPAYMSPEQAAGDEIDGRSDLFALGCVLYEMLTGETAFTGATAQAMIASRFIQTPREVAAVRPAIPQSVSQTVSRLLAKTPSDRLATGAHVITALTSAPTPVATAPRRPEDETSIAVLPFASLSRDADDEFFADGVTEEILNALAQIPRLRVAGRSSAFSFKGKNEDLRSVGAKLNVATILEGTIRRAGNRLRVTAQLSKVSDGYQLWSERYDRVAEDVFAVQDEIAGAIANRLRLTLDAAQTGRAANPPTQHLGAYELYLKGRALLYQRGRSIPRALECFEQAVALDPDYAQAWAGMADGYTTTGYSGLVRGAEVMPKAIAAARRALELDPNLAEAHNALACATLVWERDYALAEREFKRAIELNPSYTQAQAWYGLFYLQWTGGRSREAYEVLLAAAEKDPLSGYIQVILAFAETVIGRHDDAIAHGRRGIEPDPNSYLAHWSLMEALAHAGQYEEAALRAERALAVSGRHTWALCGLVSIYAGWGKPEEARRVFAEAVEREAREYMQPCMMAYAAAAAGDMDKAIAYADRAERERDPLFVLLARLWPEYNVLRPDPRFRAIVDRLHLPAERPAT